MAELATIGLSTMRDILRTLIETLRAGRDVVVCSLVETRGSTPQKAGAWMLVFADGTQAGTLGGGCVEAEVKQRALASLDGGAAELLTFNLDDNYGWDDGLICGGRMTVLAEPLRASDGVAVAESSMPRPGLRGLSPSHTDDEHDRAGLDYFTAFQSLVERGDGCTEAVIIDAERFAGASPSARVLFSSDGEVVAARRSNGSLHAIRSHLEPLDARPHPTCRGGVALLPVLPRCRLVIVGAGHVGQAVAALAAQADFDIWVIDDRDRYANAERFPAAERIIIGDIGRTLPGLEIDSKCYCIIVTRGHSHDEEALLHLAERPARYIGMIGSKRKIRLIFDDLLAAGISPEALERVHAPLGIHIGSQTVTEIAVSIVAELIAHRNLGASPRGSRMVMELTKR